MVHAQRLELRAIAGRITLGVSGSLLLAFGAYANIGIGLIMLAVLGVVFLVGWPLLLAVPHPNLSRVTMAVVFLVALSIGSWGSPTMMSFAVALSVAVSFVIEMLRSDGRQHMIDQAAATCVGALLLAMLVMWSFAWRADLGQLLAVLFAVVICAVVIIESLGTPSSRIVALINAAIVGVLMAWLLDLPLWAGVSVGMCVVLCYAATSRAVSEIPHPVPATLGASRAMIPLCVLGMVAYVLGFAVV